MKVEREQKGINPMTNYEKNELLTVSEASGILGIPESTLHDHARKHNTIGGVEVIRDGRRVYVPKRKLMDSIGVQSSYAVKEIAYYQEHILRDMIDAFKLLDMHFAIESIVDASDDKRCMGYRVVYGLSPIERKP